MAKKKTSKHRRLTNQNKDCNARRKVLLQAKRKSLLLAHKCVAGDDRACEREVHATNTYYKKLKRTRTVCKKVHGNVDNIW